MSLDKGFDKAKAVATNKAGQVQRSARTAASNQWILWLARLGYAAKGVVYILLGGLALAAAFGKGGETTDNKGAVKAIYEQPFGQVLMGLVIVGLVGYALWCFIQALADTENKGSDAKGLAKRGGFIVTGVLYGALAVFALSLLLGWGSTQKSSDQNAKDWTARLLEQPFGVVLVIAIGLGVLGYAGLQLYHAYKAKFRENPNLQGLGAKGAEWAIMLGRIGTAARGIVFAIIGIFLIIAALRQNPDEAKGIGGALSQLSSQPFGQILLAVVALGLVLYGVFCLVLAKFRQIGA